MKKILTVPIYDITIQLQVTKNFTKAVNKAGYYEPVEGGGIVLSYPSHPHTFSVIFEKGCTSPGMIGHEAYHLTKKIMSFLDLVDTPENQETGAYLHGFIVDLIHQAIFCGSGQEEK